jgi:hypothetical protein
VTEEEQLRSLPRMVGSHSPITKITLYGNLWMPKIEYSIYILPGEHITWSG